MYVLVNKQTGMYASADPDFGTMEIWEKDIHNSWIVSEWLTAATEQGEGWKDCRVEEVPAWYTNVLQCAPLFEFMDNR